MKHLVLTLWFVLFLSSSALAGVEHVTEEVCHAIAGCWVDTKTGECPNCVMETRKVVHTHEEEPVIVEEKSFVEPTMTTLETIETVTKLMSPEAYGVKSVLPTKKKTIKKKGNWTCIVSPCDFIDENGNLKDNS